jgi:hypothetical protein
MNSLTDSPHEKMPGYHFARIVSASLTMPDPEKRAAVIASARILLERGDR